MKILWIEDNQDFIEEVLNSGYFSNFLSREESKFLKKEKRVRKKIKLLRKRFSNKIIIKSNLIDAIKIINEYNEPFDRIILDIDFPLYPNQSPSKEESRLFDSMKEQLKDSYKGDDFEGFIGKIFKEGTFLGVILNHLIIRKYKEKFFWDISDIEDNICFFSGNNKGYQEFKEDMELLDNDDFRYDQDAEKHTHFFKKTKDLDFTKWLYKDLYSFILEKHIGEKASEIYKDISQNIGSTNITTIKGNLVNLRQLIEANLIKTIIHKEAKLKTIRYRYRSGEESEVTAYFPNNKDFFTHKVYEWNYVKKNRLMSDNNRINMSNCLEYLKHDKPVYYLFKYNWSAVSSLIHDDNNLTDEGNELVRNDERILNKLNLLFFQIREIILWFDEHFSK